MHVHSFELPLCLFVMILAVLAAAPQAQGDDPYRQPSAAIVDILRAPPLPSTTIDPTQRTMLLIHRQSMPKIVDMAQPMLRLAGRRINPNTNGFHGNSGMIGITIKPLDGGADIEVDIPEDVRLGFPQWAPDGSRFAFTVTREDGVWLAVCDSDSRAPSSINGRINPIGGGFRWMPDSQSVLVHFIPERPPAPERDVIPAGPVVQEASGRRSPVRTYQDLLRDPHDEALFEHHFTSQLAIVRVGPGSSRIRQNLGTPQIFVGTSVAPTGRYLLVSRIERPYSYQVPMWSFPKVVEVWDRKTDEVTRIASLPLADQTPIGGVPLGPRGIGWQSTVGTERLVWSEALDGGDPDNEVPHRDRIMMLDAPFDGGAREIHRTEYRYRGLRWMEQSSLALVSEYDRDRRWSRTWLIEPGAAVEPRLVWDRSSQDRYGDPGRPMTRTNEAGRSVAMLRDGWIWLSGAGASPEGDRPFLDRLNLESLATERLWRCGDGVYESVVDVFGRDGDRVLTRRESPVDPPNYFALDLDSGERTAITSFEDPAPQIRGVTQELVRYKRDDGVDLSATLYLPAGYDKERDGPLPLLVWAYPREFNDAYTAGQVRGSQYRFTSISGSSHRFLLLEGYAIMDGATMPVVGDDPETVNDTFIEQIVGSAKAAIDYAAERGVGDPERVGVGGHSYGAFMTANLLAHSDLFRAGVARSGAYNRTLTPFGFQSEQRTFWEAPDVYFELSPFMHADKINEPLLLIHGERDNNSGTFPIQSERLYHAVKGHAGTVRLVMLPYESHGYRAEESIMHVLAEMIDWFDRYVKSGG